MYRSPGRESWRDREARRLSVIPSPTALVSTSALPELAGTIRVMPGMAPDAIVVTGFGQSGHPLIRIEMPADWLTPSWVAWMERLMATKEGRRVDVEPALRPPLKLLE